MRLSPRFVALLAAVLVLISAATAAAARHGRAERGDRGTVQTTSELNANSMGLLPKHVQPNEQDESRPRKSANPDSPRTAELTTSARPSVLATALTSPSNFPGPTVADSHAYPPDSQGDVGPTQYIAMINGRVRSYSKLTGAPDGVLNADTDVFWSSVMTPIGGGISSNFTTDPHIRYDRSSGRWIAVMIDVPNGHANVTNRIMIAVSDGGTVTPSTTWHFFEFSAPSGEFADYPTLGVDASALYIGTNEFSYGGSYLNSNAYVVQKSSVLGAGPIVYTPFLDVINSSGTGPYTPQGVDNPTPGATTGYFAGVDASVYGQIDLLSVSSPGSTSPTLSSAQLVTIPDTQAPKDVPYLGNGGKPALDSLDDRLYAAQIRNGHLWTAHNVGVTSAGTSPSSSALVNRTATRWYDIDLSGPTLANSGTIYDPSAANPRSYWIPSVAVNGQGTMAIGGSTAGAAARPDAWFSSLQPGDAAVAAPTLYTSASADYAPPYNRWGDYSLTSVDPADDQTMWTMQEYVSATDVWGTRIAKLMAPAPAAPTSASPTTIPRGLASVHVTVTGPAGAGWFDPGSGFAKRLAVSLSCGATVNGLTVTSPTSLDVDLNTQGASKSACDATVTNPDGQAATANGLLTADARPVAADDRYALPWDAAYSGASVLANDSDADDATITAAKLTDPAHGTVTVAADGSFTYTPDPGYTGDDSFTYTAGDGLLSSSPATVRLRVIDPATNQAPTGTDDAVSVPHSARVTGNVLSNDHDANGDPLYAKKLSDPQHGTLALNSDGSFTYTAAARFQGTDSFTYSASDGLLDSPPVTVTLTGPADTAPAVTNDSYSTQPDQALDGTSVLTNDADAESDPLTAAIASSPSHGTVSLATDGTFHYVPSAGFVGTDSFSYTADDSRLISSPATVAVSVVQPAAPAAPAVTPPSPSNGSAVSILTPPAPKTRCVVPDLRRRSLSYARKALKRAHCRVGKIRRVRKAAVPHRRIVSTSPSRGKRLAAGTRIALVIRR